VWWIVGALSQLGLNSIYCELCINEHCSTLAASAHVCLIINEFWRFHFENRIFIISQQILYFASQKNSLGIFSVGKTFSIFYKLYNLCWSCQGNMVLSNKKFDLRCSRKRNFILGWLQTAFFKGINQKGVISTSTQWWSQFLPDFAIDQFSSILLVLIENYLIDAP
jgi:hypothetical protein